MPCLSGRRAARAKERRPCLPEHGPSQEQHPGPAREKRAGQSEPAVSPIANSRPVRSVPRPACGIPHPCAKGGTGFREINQQSWLSG